MDVAAKLQLRTGTRLATLGLPEGLAFDVPDGIRETDEAAAADAVLAFVVTRAELDTVAVPAFSAALADRLAWIAYPKARRLGTDLNRDVLAASGEERGVRPVRQIAIDETWSALRFRSRA